MFMLNTNSTISLSGFFPCTICLFCTYKKHKLWDRFNNLRKTVRKQLQKSKSEYLGGLVDISPNSGTASIGKRFWSHVKNIRRDSCGVATLNVQGKEITNSIGKAEALSYQYTSVFTTEDLGLL